MNRIGAARTIGLGLLIMGAGMLLLSGVPEQADYLTDFVPGYIVVGLGLGLAEMATPLAALAGRARGRVRAGERRGGDLA